MRRVPVDDESAVSFRRNNGRDTMQPDGFGCAAVALAVLWNSPSGGARGTVSLPK